MAVVHSFCPLTDLIIISNATVPTFMRNGYEFEVFPINLFSLFPLQTAKSFSKMDVGLAKLLWPSVMRKYSCWQLCHSRESSNCLNFPHGISHDSRGRKNRENHRRLHPLIRVGQNREVRCDKEKVFE